MLVYDQTATDAYLVSSLLSYHIRNVNHCEVHQILLISSCARFQDLKKQRTSTIDLLNKAINYVPRSFTDVKINPATIIVLPLQAAFYVFPISNLVVPLKVKKTLVPDVFQYNTRLNFVH